MILVFGEAGVVDRTAGKEHAVAEVYCETRTYFHQSDTWGLLLRPGRFCTGFVHIIPYCHKPSATGEKVNQVAVSRSIDLYII
jgi:hypothetical protein